MTNSLRSWRRKGKGIRSKGKRQGYWGEVSLSQFSPSPHPPSLFAPATQAITYRTMEMIALLLIYWIVVYPLNSATQLFNNWG